MPVTEPWFVLPNKPTSVEPVIILGAGLAGCHTAFELAKRGVAVQLVDAGDAVASGASGNPIAVVRPFVTRSANTTSLFYKAAFNYLLHRLEENKALAETAKFKACGVLHLVNQDYPHSEDYQLCDSEKASDIAGVTVNSNALFFERAGHINPKALCEAIVQHPNIELLFDIDVQGIEQLDNQWHLHTTKKAHNQTLVCNTLILANGQNLNQYNATKELPIIAASGQTSTFTLSDNNTNQLQCVLTGKHYVIPQDDCMVVGATYARNADEQALTHADQETKSLANHAKNLAALNANLPETHVEPKAVSGFCGTRATTPDRLPLLGPAPNIDAYKIDYEQLRHGPRARQFAQAQYHNNLFVIGGFGSRGVVSAPFSAYLLAQHICAINELEQDALSNWSTLLHAGRFTIRTLKRKR